MGFIVIVLEMLANVDNSSWIINQSINNGLVLPETLNMIYYDVIEDIYYGEDDYCDYQNGLTGIFTSLIGWALGLPPLYNVDNGDAGVGVGVGVGAPTGTLNAKLVVVL